MRFQSYFNTAIKIIQSYDDSIPLQHFLKQYFSLHKKHGSKDRKFITHLCYSFYRLGKSFKELSTEEKLKLALFICNDTVEDWKFLYDDEWLNNHSKTLEERISFVQAKYPFTLNDVFPFENEISKSLDVEAFTKSFFVQPDVFMRIRPGYNEKVINKLQEHNIAFHIIEENCISFSASTGINTIINIDEEAVIQDYSSQKVKEFLIQPAISYQQPATSDKKSEIPVRTGHPGGRNLKPEIKVWDCCAGSGGKSILAYDVFEKIDLTVSDVRPSIIQNLKQRFEKVGIKGYKSLVADLTNSQFPIPNSGYDLIICDAPCTGSGTWSRTPEQLYFFDAEKINEYATRQQKIVSNAIPLLKNNGCFLYITCSVFEKENEGIAMFIQQQFKFELIQMELLKGYAQKADTMFAALFKKI